MKQLFLLLITACGLLAADATGTWQGTLKSPDHDGTAYLILRQQGGVLTGSGGPNAEKQLPISNGKIQNEAITFDVEEGDHLMKFDLKIDGDEIKGSMKRIQDDEAETGELAVNRLKAPTQDLLNKIAALDAAIFDAYNKCDLKAFASYLAEDVEFFHDKGGLMNSRASVVASVKENVCGKLRRELVPGKLEVYPIPGYGAIEVGSHRFYIRKENGGEEPAGGAPKFLHIWREKDGDWKLTRVVSYSH